MTDRTDTARLKLRPQILSGDEIAMGPGKAALLDAIAETGSISAAGRRLGMSYRRTWLLVDAMNRCWAEPLVAAVTGGVKGGGARVTPFGAAVRADYAAWAARLAEAGAGTEPLLARLRAEPLAPGSH
ncbi:winged helix-turn-helix domain-containing protein [Sphingomonas solaris]|uniref:LysR family transcriptional regulator n=1 Tax=Alterirhizorhabdus solaris TaxID=2529389 RepID=A0A558QTQ4_9SPHN|nr:LysR family transcriptional regulator [Sphingomonas solaris]TVV70509.1 LysR family transcriptional regulator [Sphingomonas solaris]